MAAPMETKMKIIRMLEMQELNTRDLTERLHITREALSAHMISLREEGIVACVGRSRRLNLYRLVSLPWWMQKGPEREPAPSGRKRFI